MEIKFNTKYNKGDFLYKINQESNIEKYMIQKVSFMGTPSDIHITYTVFRGNNPINISESNIEKNGYFSSKNDILKHIANQI